MEHSAVSIRLWTLLSRVQFAPGEDSAAKILFSAALSHLSSLSEIQYILSSGLFQVSVLVWVSEPSCFV